MNLVESSGPTTFTINPSVQFKLANMMQGYCKVICLKDRTFFLELHQNSVQLDAFNATLNKHICSIAVRDPVSLNSVQVGVASRNDEILIVNRRTRLVQLIVVRNQEGGEVKQELTVALDQRFNIKSISRLQQLKTRNCYWELSTDLGQTFILSFLKAENLLTITDVSTKRVAGFLGSIFKPFLPPKQTSVLVQAFLEEGEDELALRAICVNDFLVSVRPLNLSEAHPSYLPKADGNQWSIDLTKVLPLEIKFIASCHLERKINSIILYLVAHSGLGIVSAFRLALTNSGKLESSDVVQDVFGPHRSFRQSTDSLQIMLSQGKLFAVLESNAGDQSDNYRVVAVIAADSMNIIHAQSQKVAETRLLGTYGQQIPCFFGETEVVQILPCSSAKSERQKSKMSSSHQMEEEQRSEGVLDWHSRWAKQTDRLKKLVNFEKYTAVLEMLQRKESQLWGLRHTNQIKELDLNSAIKLSILVCLLGPYKKQNSEDIEPCIGLFQKCKVPYSLESLFVENNQEALLSFVDYLIGDSNPKSQKGIFNLFSNRLLDVFRRAASYDSDGESWRDGSEIGDYRVWSKRFKDVLKKPEVMNEASRMKILDQYLMLGELLGKIRQVDKQILKSLLPGSAEHIKNRAIQYASWPMLELLWEKRLVNRVELNEFILNLKKQQPDADVRSIVQMLAMKEISLLGSQSSNISFLLWIPPEYESFVLDLLEKHAPRIAILFGIKIKKREHVAKILKKNPSIVDAIDSPLLFVDIYMCLRKDLKEAKEFEINFHLAQFAAKKKIKFVSYNLMKAKRQKMEGSYQGNDPAWKRLEKALEPFRAQADLSIIKQALSITK